MQYGVMRVEAWARGDSTPVLWTVGKAVATP